jgi:hypothetical protein
MTSQKSVEKHRRRIAKRTELKRRWTLWVKDNDSLLRLSGIPLLIMCDEVVFHRYLFQRDEYPIENDKPYSHEQFRVIQQIMNQFYTEPEVAVMISEWKKQLAYTPEDSRLANQVAE